MKTIENLEWRYATKVFDNTKKVSHEDIQQLKKAVQLSVSSFGLQLYKVLIIEDQLLKEKLKPASWNQNQITDASHLFVFCNYSNVTPTDVDAFIQNISTTRNLPMDRLEGYRKSIKDSIANKSETELKSWLEKQAYLALGNLLMACAELKIDACPMEGFIPDMYNEILNLKEEGLNACLIAPIGYRSTEDKSQFLEKVRKSEKDLFLHV